MNGISSPSHRGRLRNFRLTAEQDAKLEEIAAEEGRTVSNLIRYTLERALFLPPDGKDSPVIGIERAPQEDVTAPSPMSRDTGLQENEQGGGDSLVSETPTPPDDEAPTAPADAGDEADAEADDVSDDDEE